MPVGPVVPCGPVAPDGPDAPVAPVTPAPVGPVVPCGPVGPVGPVGPATLPNTCQSLALLPYLTYTMSSNPPSLRTNREPVGASVPFGNPSPTNIAVSVIGSITVL